MFANPRMRLFAGAFLISFSPVFVRLVDVAPTTSAFYRVLIGGLVLAGFLAVTRRRPRFSAAAWLALGASAAFFTLDLWFWHRSIIYIGPGLSTLLANMQVFFMMAAGLIMLRQRPSIVEVIAAAMAVAGIALIAGPQWRSTSVEHQLGIVFGILTAISYAGYMLSMRKARLQSTYTVPVREIAVMSLVAAGMLGIVGLSEGADFTVQSIDDAGWLLAYGALSHGVGLIFIASSLDKVTTTVTGIALLLQPSLSLVWDVLFFGRALTGIEAAGALLALAAIFIGTVRR